MRTAMTLPRAALTVVLTMAFAAAMFVVAPPPVAEAARWHNIAGVTHRNTDWYISSTVRTKNSFGAVSAEFSELLDGSTLRFCVHNRTCSDFNVTGNEQDMAWDMHNGEQFRNSFRRLSGCGFGCDQDFAGQQRY